MHHLDLAWELLAATRGCLSARERMNTYVAVGGGDTYTAIRNLTSLAVTKRVPLPRAVTRAIEQWWAAHDDGADEFGELVASLGRQPEPPHIPPAPAQPHYLAVKRRYRRIGTRHTARGVRLPSQQ